jgi:hypothetical protein
MIFLTISGVNWTYSPCMENKIIPGKKGEPLQSNIIVVRLAKYSSGSVEGKKAHETHFSLSTADELSELQSLSVWVRELTPPEQARMLMGQNRDTYKLALHLNVDNIRAINFTQDAPVPPLDVVWDTDHRPGAEGHSGITGLKRPPNCSRVQYKTIRSKLARTAKVEILPEIETTS